jgi:translation initiation factor 1A
LGKKKVISEEEIKDMVLPVANDVLGIAMKLLGFDRVLVKCQEGHERLCRIRGKMKRRVWVREGDVVLVSHGTFNPTNAATSFGATQELKPNCSERTTTSPFRREANV